MSKNLANIKLEGGYRHVLRLAWPMILSTSSVSIMHFADRVFVAWYSQDSLAASLPAGITSFTFLAFFIGTAAYVSTFVAQYCGAGREHRIGPAVWQGIYFALAAMVFMWTLYPLAQPIMDFAGHAPDIRILEVKYFKILVLGGGFIVLQTALNGFYTGRGRMYTIMAVSFAVNTVNVVLNYCWIFGHLGFPAWGLVGAGWATVVAQALGVVIMACLFFSHTNRRRFRTTTNIGLDKDLFRRLLRYGAANGLHFFVGISAFNFFIILVGRKGPIELAATTTVITINHLAFMPMFGLAITTSTLVGQFVGRNRPDLAQRSTTVALRMVTVYMGLIAAVFLLVPEPLLRCFKSQDGQADFPAILELGKTLLIFVACYCLVDGLAIIYSAALKGAGDTFFALILTAVLSWSILVLPVYLSITYFGAGIRTSFAFIIAYFTALAIGFYLRYRGGKWKKLRVIEPEVLQPTVLAEGPLVET